MVGSAFTQLQQSPGKFYKETTQPKMKFGSPQKNSDGSFKMRYITKPTYYIKVFQRGLHDQLKNLELPDCMHGGITESNNVTNALEHISSRFFFTVDLKGFFNNITNSQVHQTLISRGFTWNEARAITNLTTYNGALPQGAPTSTTLANLVFSSTAEILETFCKERNIIFTVFVDDLTFSSIECFKKHTNQILETLKQNGFFVNHRKVHYRKDSCEVTGIIVRKGKLFLPKEIISHRNKPGVDKYIESVLKQYNAYKAIANYK